MNANEPVAYIDPYDLERLPHYDCHIGSQKMKNGIPLYTHPYKPSKSEVNALLDNADYVIGTMREEIEKLKAKTLTDEEINEVVWQQNLLISNDGLRDFAKAILRKAQEK